MIQAPTIKELAEKLLTAGNGPDDLVGQMDRAGDSKDWFFSFMKRADGAELERVGIVTNPMVDQDQLQMEIAAARVVMDAARAAK